MLSLKNEKNLLKEDASHLKLASHNKRQKKNIEKESKTKIEKKSNNNDEYSFTSTLLYRKIYILLENIFGKTCFT